MRDVLDIPDKFSSGDVSQPVAKSVGELIKLLQEIPEETPIEQGLFKGCRVTVMNVNLPSRHVCFGDLL